LNNLGWPAGPGCRINQSVSSAERSQYAFVQAQHGWVLKKSMHLPAVSCVRPGPYRSKWRFTFLVVHWRNRWAPR